MGNLVDLLQFFVVILKDVFMRFGSIVLGIVTLMYWWYGIQGCFSQWAIIEHGPDIDLFGQLKSTKKKRHVFMYTVWGVVGLLLIKWTFRALCSLE